MTSAIFSVILLGKRLEAVQWISLVLLSVGVMMVQVITSQPCGAGSNGSLSPRQERLTL